MERKEKAMTEIFHHGGSQREGWLYVNEAGQLVYHSENDGHAFWRKGAEACDELLTFEQALKRFPKRSAPRSRKGKGAVHYDQRLSGPPAKDLAAARLH
jgi:hypothetical protein